MLLCAVKIPAQILNGRFSIGIQVFRKCTPMGILYICVSDIFSGSMLIILINVKIN